MVRTAGPSIVFTEANISELSLHAVGAIVLLVAWVDPDTIRVLGRWRSDTMLLYLHTTSKIFTEDLAVKLYQHGTYAIIPPAHAGN